MDLFRAQSERFGTRIFTETISKIDLSRRPFRYWREGLELEEPETADTIIIATGASARRLNLPGEETYWQSGISACAVCDGAVPIFRKKPLAVVGGGDSACEEATYLTKVKAHFRAAVCAQRADHLLESPRSTLPKCMSLSDAINCERARSWQSDSSAIQKSKSFGIPHR